MILRLLALPVALVAGLSLVSAQPAEAAPIAPVGKMRPGGVHVGIGVGFPIGGGRRHGFHGGGSRSYGYAGGGYRSYAAPAGYWSVQTVPVTVPVTMQVQVPYQVAVQVPDQVIGTDANGSAVWSYRTELRTEHRLEMRTEYRTEYQTQRVWVATGYGQRQSRGWGQVGVGFHIR